MFQQRAESEDQAELMYTSYNILERPSNLGGSAHQSQLIYTSNSSLEESIHQLHSNLGGSAHQSDQFFPGSDVCYTVFGWFNRLLWKAITQLAPSSNQGGSAHQPQLSEAQFLANDIWRGLVQPNVNLGGWLSPTQSRGVQPNVNPGQSVQPNVNPRESVPDVNPEGRSYLRQSEDQFDIWRGLVQPNVNPGQSVQPNVNTRESEPDVNPGERSYPTQSEDQFDILTADVLNHYRPLYLAAQSGDWKAAICFIYNDPNALTAKITAVTGKTVLHVAACCWQWEFVLNLLEHITSPESIAVKTRSGKTVLHYVAQGGSLKTAEALVQMNSELPQIKDKDEYLPLFHSISSGNEKLVRYLSLKTIDESSSDHSFSKILRYLIISGYHDIALYFVKKYPSFALAKDDDGGSLLYWLARNPSSFFSGSNLGILERWIYKFVHVDIRNSQSHYCNTEDFSERSFATQVLRWFKRLFWKTITQLVAYVEKVRDAKLKHEYAVVLVNHVCEQLSRKNFQEIMNFLLDPKDIMTSAVRDGIEEIVRALFLQFPDLIDALLMPDRYLPDLIDDRLMPKRTILQTAIKYRQVKIVNIIKEILPSLQLATTKSKSENQMKTVTANSKSADPIKTLQLVGELAPPSKLHSVPGAALQMLRELQWFKEVKEIEFPILWDINNEDGETPEEVFRKKHEDLAKEGEKWMKDTAESCMVVSALIATVLFAAAFTVPGGNTNDDKGIPIFLRTNRFTIFAISDALGLFSSLTSLLTFLSIITAQYEIEDFLESLPKKLIVGLGSLFVAIAAMIIAFGAALTIVLNERLNWVFVLINLLAPVPVVMFVWLQLPLFFQMVQSTCGASMFRPLPSRKFE